MSHPFFEPLSCLLAAHPATLASHRLRQHLGSLSRRLQYHGQKGHITLPRIIFSAASGNKGQNKKHPPLHSPVFCKSVAKVLKVVHKINMLTALSGQLRPEVYAIQNSKPCPLAVPHSSPHPAQSQCTTYNSEFKLICSKFHRLL